MDEKIIGILAGMGPKSTAPFVNLVIDECQRQYGAKYDDEFPPMMIYSLPTPFYIDRPINHELMKSTIIKGLQKLESVGVSFIAMPCNSAHIYFKDLQDSINIPLLNIVEKTVNQLPNEPQRVTIFSTVSTLESGIYQNGIMGKGYKFVFKNEWQSELNELIQTIKTDKEKVKNIVLWKKLIEDVKREAVNSIVIACTDLNVVLEEEIPDFYIIDSSKCLAQVVVKKYLEMTKR